jgi:mannosyltransferase
MTTPSRLRESMVGVDRSGTVDAGRLALPALSGLLARHGLLLIVCAGAVIRFATLGGQSLWLDEHITLEVIRGHGSGDDLISVMKAVQVTESNPPLYYLALWGWEKLAGSGEIGIRSLSALFGVAAIPVVFLAGRALGSRRAGLVAAALTAASPLLIWYSQEARNYELLVLLGALSFLCFVRALADPGHRWLWGWALASALALTAHYFAFALIVPEAIWLLARRRRERSDVGLALATIGVVGLALLPLVATQRGRGSWIDDYDFGGRLIQVPEHLLVGFTVPWPTLAGIVLALVTALAVYGAARTRNRTPIAIAWSVVAGGLAVLLILVVAGDDYILTRNLLELWAPFAVGLGLILASKSLGRLGLVAAALLCAGGLALAIWTAVTPEARRPDHAELAGALGAADRQRLLVSQTTFSSPLTIYMENTRPATDAELAASELVVVDPRRTESYAVGTCWWLHTCGGVDLSPPPRFEVPSAFEPAERGSTRLYDYRVYRASEPIAIERPTEYFTPRVFVQAPAD